MEKLTPAQHRLVAVTLQQAAMLEVVLGQPQIANLHLVRAVTEVTAARRQESQQRSAENP